MVFDRGLIAGAESNVPEERLEDWLSSAGIASASALEEARIHASDPPDLPRTLVLRDLVRREALSEALPRRVGSIVQAAFAWDGGRFRFEDRESVVTQLEPDVVSTAQWILDGVKTVGRFDPVLESVSRVDRRLRCRRPSPVPVDRLRLTPADGFTFSRVDGSTTPGEVVSVLPPDEEDGAVRFLYALLVLGVLELDPPVSEGAFRIGNLFREQADRRILESTQEQTVQTAYATTASSSPHDVLGVMPEAKPDAIERAYQAAKNMFAADQLLPAVRAKLRTEIATIESRLLAAYVQLNQPEREEATPEPVADGGEGGGEAGGGVEDMLVRVEMDKAKSKIAHEKATQAADSHFAQARRALREGDFHNAIQFVKLAISFNDQDARYFRFLGECQARNPGARWQHMAEQSLTRATELDPWNADHRVRLGAFYKKRGMASRARKQFEEALHLSPSHPQATEELASLAHLK